MTLLYLATFGSTIISIEISSHSVLQAVNFILQIMDPSNSVMRKICYHSSMAALKEVVHVFPMVSLNDSWTRLAVGDVIGEINSANIRVYDLQRSELICVFFWV